MLKNNYALYPDVVTHLHLIMCMEPQEEARGTNEFFRGSIYCRDDKH